MTNPARWCFPDEGGRRGLERQQTIADAAPKVKYQPLAGTVDAQSDHGLDVGGRTSTEAPSIASAQHEVADVRRIHAA